MTAIFEDRARANIATEKLKVYAQPQRLMILSFLASGEHNVGAIDAATGIGQPALSQQLAELRRADLVKTRRVSKQVLYDLAGEDVALCVRSMEAILGSTPDPKSALARAIQDQPKAKSKNSGAEENADTGAAQFAKIL